MSITQMIGGSTSVIVDDALIGAALTGVASLNATLSVVEFVSTANLKTQILIENLVLDASNQPVGGSVLNVAIFQGVNQLVSASFGPPAPLVSTFFSAWNAASGGDFTLFNALILSFEVNYSASGSPGGVTYASPNGNDALTGSAFSDTLDGRDGNDNFVGHAGADFIYGGGGLDTINYFSESGTLGVVANLTTGVVTDTFGHTDTVSGIEAIGGTIHNDAFVGNGGFNAFLALGGTDTAAMGGGLDMLALTGPRGNYTINLAAGTSQDTVGGTGSVAFSGVEFIGFGAFSNSSVMLELVEHTGFSSAVTFNMTEDLLAANVSTGALKFWDSALAGPEQITTLGNRQVIGMGNLSGDLSDDIIYRTNTGWYGVIDSMGVNTNIGNRNGQSMVAVGDFSGDGRDDLLFRNDSTGYISYLRGGDLANVNVGSRAGQTLVAVGDFNGDAKEDLLFQSDGSGWLSYARGGDFANINVGYRAGQEMLAVGDFDGDGRDDVLFRNTTSGWMSYAKSGNGANVNLGYRVGQELLGAGDFNDDGSTDLLFKNSGGWISYMNGKTGANSNVGFASGKTLVSVGDYNGDGSADLLFQNDTTKVVSFLSAANPAQSVVLGNLTGHEILSGDFGTNMGDDMLIA